MNAPGIVPGRQPGDDAMLDIIPHDKLQTVTRDGHDAIVMCFHDSIDGSHHAVRAERGISDWEIRLTVISGDVVIHDARMSGDDMRAWETLLTRAMNDRSEKVAEVHRKTMAAIESLRK
jgi:hypothetical protein